MKKILTFTVVILFSINLYSYEVKMSRSRKIEPSPTENTVIIVDDLSDLPPIQKPILVDKTYISFKCEAKLTASEFSKDEQGRILVSQNMDLTATKDLGRLKPDENSIQILNRGELEFNFKVQNKILNFDLSIRAPNALNDNPEDNDLFIQLSYHKTYKMEHGAQRLSSTEASHIVFDSDKSLPGGFSLSVNIGEKIIKNHGLYLKVHCTDPKKEIKQVEIFKY